LKGRSVSKGRLTTITWRKNPGSCTVDFGLESTTCYKEGLYPAKGIRGRLVSVDLQKIDVGVAELIKAGNVKRLKARLDFER